MSHCICNNTRVRLPVANESPANAAPRHRTEPLTRTSLVARHCRGALVVEYPPPTLWEHLC
jgi:hypothetical protein